MATIITWLQAHWIEVLAILGGAHAIAKVIVAWTPTPTDDNILAGIVAFLKKIVQIIGLQP